MEKYNKFGSHAGILSRAWYSASIEEFLRSDHVTILGLLAQNSEFAVMQTQRDAWISQIEFLQSSLKSVQGTLFFEFNIPRMGKRIDVVLLIGSVVFVVEFKVGEEAFDQSSFEQVWDYALDLKNFHEASHSVSIVPVLIATGASKSPNTDLQCDDDNVYRPISAHPAGFRAVVDLALRSIVGTDLEAQQWAGSRYSPTPTIVEAARALYAQHSVEAIARHDAGAQNLAVTSRRIEELIDEARARKQKLICFVTGVPGAGKTLVGLNVATQRRERSQPTHAVYLSGNGPLVAVLQEALTRDEVARRKTQCERVRKKTVHESVKAFIQIVHHFRDEALRDPGPPIDHVVIFDEAQRAWNLRQTANFMRRKKGQPGFAESEPEFLISYMDRHSDWAVVVCLVGGGQDINTGEAGIDAWIEAIETRFPKWHMYISDKLTDSEYGAGNALTAVRKRPNSHFDESLHLAVSMRSFRAENVSSFVKAVLDCELRSAREHFAALSPRFPIAITRDLGRAKDWVRSHARGSERFGLVASSKAQRLKPHAVDIRVDVNPIHWFLNGREDTRSSYFLEDAATEFQVQGLELDWVCVTWDADLRMTEKCWSYHDFRGDKWTKIQNEDNRRYLLNAYRVLLTRARQGMVIFVPRGDSSDHTRSHEYYDKTYNYLTEVGIPVI
jgi:hypothetical protein